MCRHKSNLHPCVSFSGVRYFFNIPGEFVQPPERFQRHPQQRQRQHPRAAHSSLHPAKAFCVGPKLGPCLGLRLWREVVRNDPSSITSDAPESRVRRRDAASVVGVGVVQEVVGQKRRRRRWKRRLCQRLERVGTGLVDPSRASIGRNISCLISLLSWILLKTLRYRFPTH